MIETRWGMLAVLFLARTVLGFQFQTIASTESSLRPALGMGFAEIGTLIGAYMLPGIFVALPGGLLIRRFGDKTVCLTGLALMAVGGVVTGLGDSYGLLVVGRVIAGMGGVFLSLAITKMVTDWFAAREIVTAMSVMLTSWPVGMVFGLVIFLPLSESHGWASVMYLSAGACVVALIAIAGLYRSPDTYPAISANPVQVGTFPPAQEARPVLVAGVAWGALNLGFIVFFSFGPPLFVAHGLSLTAGSAMTSIALWLTAISMPLGGLWVQRLRRPDRATMLFSILVAVAMVVLSLFPAAGLASVIAVGLLIGPPPGAIMAMPGRVLHRDHRSVGLGLFLTVYYVAVTVGPMIAGVLRDRLGAEAPVLFGAALFVAIAPLTALFGSLSRRNSMATRAAA